MEEVVGFLAFSLAAGLAARAVRAAARVLGAPDSPRRGADKDRATETP